MKAGFFFFSGRKLLLINDNDLTLFNFDFRKHKWNLEQSDGGCKLFRLLALPSEKSPVYRKPHEFLNLPISQVPLEEAEPLV